MFLPMFIFHFHDRRNFKQETGDMAAIPVSRAILYDGRETCQAPPRHKANAKQMRDAFVQ